MDTNSSDANRHHPASIAGVADDLLRHLTTGGRVVDVSKRFVALGANSARVDLALELLGEYGLLPEAVADAKSDEESLKVRQRGNEMFKNKRRKEAIETYTKSACLAKSGEFLAVAYANRSAVLLEVGLVEECLRDIERAIGNGYPEHLQQKLMNRKEKATVLLKEQSCISLVHHLSIPKILKDQKNSYVQCASDAIAIKSTPNEGRHVVATRDIKIGEVIVVERPFCHILLEEFFIHCHHCLKLCYDMIPCESCTQTLYCTEKCKEEAFSYHEYECPILATTKKLQMDKLKLLPMRIAVLIKDQYDLIKKDILKPEDTTYRSDRYLEIHNLVANTEKRSVSDLFRRAVTSAIIFHLIESSTTFFQNNTSKDIFKNVVLFHTQTSACNFHSISEITEHEFGIYSGIYQDVEIGAGAYSFSSMFNHACDPNVARFDYGPVIVARAVASIKKGEQCYDNYGHHFAVMPKEERQKKLKEQYFFDCSCDACVKNYPLIYDLPLISNAESLPLDDWTRLERGDVDAAKRIAEETVPKMEKLEEPKPNKNFYELQEVVKQCYSLQGNIRRPI